MSSITTSTHEALAGKGRTAAASPWPYSVALSIVFLVILCLAYAINAADRQIFPTLLPAIAKTFGYDVKVAGLMATVFTLGLAVVGIPAGYILGRASRKSIILIAMVIYSVFTLATVYAYGFWDMLFFRAMTGVGEGMQMAALFAAVGAYFHQRRSFFIGWMIVAYGGGAWAGPRLGAMLSQSTGWQTPFIWFAVAGLVIAAIVLLVVPKGFTESKGPGTSGAAIDEAAFAHIPVSVWNRNMILGGIGAIILGYSLYGYIGLYTTYLQTGLHLPPAAAAAAFSFFGLGGLLSFVGGWLGDRYPQQWVTAIAFALLAVVGYSVYNVATSSEMQSFLSFMTGALGSGVVFVNVLSLMQRSVRPQAVGLASGTFLTCLFGAASTAGYLMGWLVGQFGWGTAALIELTVLPVIGIVAMAMVNTRQLISVAKKG